MSKINYDIALYRSPYYENLIEELHRISAQKRNIYKKIKTENDFHSKLSFEERGILKDLSEREDKIIFEILMHKDWFINNNELLQSFKQKFGINHFNNEKDDFDRYPVNFI